MCLWAYIPAEALHERTCTCSLECITHRATCTCIQCMYTLCELTNDMYKPTKYTLPMWIHRCINWTVSVHVRINIIICPQRHYMNVRTYSFECITHRASTYVYTLCELTNVQIDRVSNWQTHISPPLYVWCGTSYIHMHCYSPGATCLHILYISSVYKCTYYWGSTACHWGTVEA